MTEAEKKSFLTLSSARAPGKRQIKPNTSILMETVPIVDSDEDEDFVAGKTDGELSSDSNSSSTDDDSDDDADGDDDDDDSDARNSRSKGRTTVEDLKPELGAISASGSNTQPDQLICTLCLNQRVVVRNDEIIQCDKCGLAVHENCYVTESPGDAESDGSSSSTEPWFCEPCLYGLKEPPYCELCPNRFGAFKKSDIGGSWVHLLCALYTPGITFGDVERLSAVSWQEVDYKLFGRRACVACPDPLMARTGIAVPCDAALCKNYLHVTCAQRLGLLIDNTERTADPNLSNSSNTNSKNFSTYDVEAVDPLYLTCRRHANEDLMKQRKTACELLYKQEETRMLRIRRRALNQREERKRVRMLERHRSAMKNLEGVTIAWPEHDSKRPRLLHTSARYLELFAEKAESVGISRQKFIENFIKIDGAQLPYLPPGFSNHFVEYFNNREKNVIPEETMKLEALKRENEELRAEQKKLQDELNMDPIAVAAADSKILQEWYETLHSLGLRKLKKPAAPIESKTKKTSNSSNSSKKFQNLPVATNPSTSGAFTSTKGTAEKRIISDSGAAKAVVSDSAVVDLKINTCDECKKATDQHLLTQCDMCRKYYHLGCLEPPLLKMPKKTNTQGWACSLCCEVSSNGDEEKAKVIVDGPRKLRDRSLATEKRKEEEKAERKAFRAAIRNTRHPGSAHHKNSNKNPPTASLNTSNKTVGPNAANHSMKATSVAATGRKRTSSDHLRRHTVGDLNGIHQQHNNNSFMKKLPSCSPPTSPQKRKRRSSLNLSPSSSPKLKSKESIAAHSN